MKLSYNWLKDYLKCDLSAAQIAQAMTSIGIEVDSVEEQEQIPGSLAGVVVAKVLECEAHPDSDHLHITKVDDGSTEPLTVVCGAPNVAAGQKVLFARIGTVLPGDFKIKKSKIRGVESFGMICAEDELGIGSSHDGIMVLEDEAVVGTPAKEYLHLETQAVIEYEITANRVDAASHWGVARDLYAYLRRNGIPCSLSLPDVSSFSAGDSSDSDALDVQVLDSDGAPCYSGITIRGVKVGPSPEWLQKKLLSIGSHPINNIVDISNFVLFELGQPLHTFDADKVRGSKVIVRRAAEGEAIRTLDSVERKLSSCDMVIADAEGPMCIAGVFGGEDSGVSDATVNLFVESAYFDPASIRKTSKSQTLQTDASFRYERGADPLVTDYALRRAVNLILECAGGKVCGPVRKICPKPYEKKQIELDYDRIARFSGCSLSASDIESILTDLGYEFISRREGGSVVAAPSYMVDVYRECDVVEELMRIWGYDNVPLPDNMRMSVNATPRPEKEAIRNNISNFLAANGFVETMNNSLTKADYYESLESLPAAKCVRIVNPLSQELNVMRQSLIPGALETIAYNINRQVSSLKIFEYGSVYSRIPGKPSETLEGYEEHPCFCLAMSGSGEKTWSGEPRKSSFFLLKGYVELLLKRYGADIYQMGCTPAPSDIFSEGVCYILPGSGTPLAVIGTVAPAFARKFGVKQSVYVAELNFNTLFELVRRDKVSFTELPKFPSVRRDLALLLDESVSYAALRACALKQAKKLLKQVGLFDVYRGDKIPQGKKQYAMSFVIQDAEKTLTDQDTERVMERILAAFQKEFGAQLR